MTLCLGRIVLSKRILSFGGGLQTTALAILVKQGKVQADEAVFADTGCEKPETYWYMENYTKPLFEEIGIPFTCIKNEQPYYQPDLYGFLWRKEQVPNIRFRECTDHFKIRPIKKYVGGHIVMLIGFSWDEQRRAVNRKVVKWQTPEYPLIDMRITAEGCRDIVKDYGWPIPLKSSCFICQYQKVVEWNWLKNTHPELFQKALELEEHYHNRRPDMRNSFGLLGGTPLWRLKNGIQPEMFQLEEQSCWSGYCSH